ncbi:MAG: hypothetical protein U0556_09405 [Dehalococcoidia bacterium]
MLSPITEHKWHLPPMFASGIDPSQLGGSFVALPPVPERVSGVAELSRIAQLRDDDLLDGGRLYGGPERLFQAAAEAVQEYLRLYEAGLKPMIDQPIEAQVEPFDVDAVLFELMTDQARVGELAKLTGKLRYAVEVRDSRLLDETVAEVRRVGRYLPASYRLEDFLKAASAPGPPAGALTALYLDRCYKLAAEEYAEVARLEREIAAAEAG